MSHFWISGSIDFLERSYDPERALFSYSSSLTPNGFTNDFDHPAVIRYTINSLLGLQEAAAAGETGRPVDAYPDMLHAFLKKNLAAVNDWADKGLLLVLLTREEAKSTEASQLVSEIGGFVERDDTTVDLQSMAWMLWGTSLAARTGWSEADTIARKLFTRIHSRYLDRNSLLARHSLARYRRDLVSFGGTVYYLRALHEYATTTGDEYAHTLFDWGVKRVIEMQGPLGEWPWMLSVSRAAIVDPYPVFSVHQDAMAMLFLLPALDRDVPGAMEAISSSCLWVGGRNELSKNLVNEDPFFICRSIRRIEKNERARRYLRQFAPKKDGWRAAPRDQVEVNPESRSYHIGWILFAWSNRQRLLEEALAPAAEHLT